MYKRLVMLLMISLLLVGFRETALNVTIRFDRVHGLKKGDKVIFDENHIGKVGNVLYTEEGCYKVHVTVQKEFANAATQHCEFFIIPDPERRGKKAIEMVRVKDGGEPLHDGATIEGSTKYSAVFAGMLDDLEKTLNDLKKQFKQFSDELRKIPEGEKFKKFEEELDRLSEEIKRTEKAARDKLEKEILPRLKREIEKLRKRLREMIQEEESKPIKV